MNDVNFPSRSILGASLRPLTKRAGSGSQRYGSEDPDPAVFVSGHKDASKMLITYYLSRATRKPAVTFHFFECSVGKMF
jgi:hypothetical protein